jgi:hypothetical protein
MNSNLTLRQNYERSRNEPQPTQKWQPPAKPLDPLAKWLSTDVSVVFMSGRTLEGKLCALHRFAVEIVDAEGTLNHVPKHGIERVWQRK